MITIVEMSDGTIFKVPGKTIAAVNATIVAAANKKVQNYGQTLRGIGAVQLIGGIGEGRNRYTPEKNVVAEYKGLGIEVYEVPDDAVVVVGVKK